MYWEELVFVEQIVVLFTFAYVNVNTIIKSLSQYLKNAFVYKSPNAKLAYEVLEVAPLATTSPYPYLDCFIYFISEARDCERGPFGGAKLKQWQFLCVKQILRTYVRTHAPNF